MRRSQNLQHGTAQGFTLIEVITVVVILSILAVLGTKFVTDLRNLITPLKHVRGSLILADKHWSACRDNCAERCLTVFELRM